MYKKEKSAVMSLAAIMAFRMLGLFMIYPLFAAHAHELKHTSAFLIGLALGIYGLSQACLQMPLGALSDRFGRKPIIAVGLGLFALGSIVGAFSHTIYGMILARALQGTGAIGSTTLALVADLTRDEFRSKAMAMVGLTIGFAFTIAIIVGPIINAWFNLQGIFWVTTALAFVGMMLLFLTVPTPPKLTHHDTTTTNKKQFRNIFQNKQLLRLDAGILLLHALLTSMFIAIPILLTHVIYLSQNEQIGMYLIVLLLSFVLMTPLIIIGEKRRKLKGIFVGAIAGLFITQLLLFKTDLSLVGVGAILLLFFTSFTLLEASLPSLVSKFAPIRQKGTAMGIYSTSQFFGIFLGGVLGGTILSHFGIHGIFIFGSALTAIWLVVASTMKQPPYLSTVVLPYSGETQDIIATLAQHRGVAEAASMSDENLIYLKIDRQQTSEHELRNLIEQGTLS